MAHKSQNLNQNIALIGVLLILVGLATSYFYFVPRLRDARQSLAQTKAKDDGLKADIQTLQTAKIDLESAKQSLQQQGVNFDRLRYVFPPTEDIPQLYIQMDQLMGSTAGISNASYQISPPVSQGVGEVRVPLTVTASGSYATIKSFMHNLETNIRPLTLSNVSLSQAIIKDKDGRVTGTSSSDYTVNITGFARAQNISQAYTDTNGGAAK